MRKILGLVGVGLVVIILLFVGVSLLQQHNAEKGAKKVSNAFVAEVLNNGVSSSYQQFTASAKQSQDSNDWAVTVSTLSSFFSGKQASLISTDQQLGGYTFTYKISGRDGDYNFIVMTEKEKTGWHVASFNSKLKV